jgi:hypothetical protein
LLSHVILHELGHALAFDHSECGPESSVMYPGKATKVRLADGALDYLQIPTHADRCAISRDFSTGSQGHNTDCSEDSRSMLAASFQDGRGLPRIVLRVCADNTLVSWLPAGTRVDRCPSCSRGDVCGES